jgi:hypothetical protein
MSQPGLDLASRAALKRNLDQSGVPAVEAAKEVYCVSEVATAVRTGCFEKAVEVRMARATVTRDAGKLRFGNADRIRSRQSGTLTGFLAVDGPVDCHSFPLG